MPNNQDQPLSIAEIYEAAENPNTTQIAEDEALRQKYMQRFEFDPEVSLWDEAELKKKQQAERLRAAAEANKEHIKPILNNETRMKIAMDDIGTMGAIGAGVGSLNFKNMSSAEIQDKMLSIAPKISQQNKNLARKYQEVKTRRPKTYGPDVASEIRRQGQELPSLNQKPIDQQRAEPINDQGNRYINAVKRGAANTIQTVALLHDFGYLGFERVMEAAGGKDIGQPINSALEPTQNKVFRAMEELKKEKYGASSELNNLMQGAELAGQQAEKDDRSATVAAIRYMMENGELGDFGEVLAETVPSLALGIGTGAVARRTIGAAAERAAASRAGALARRAGETVDPKRLAKFAAPVGGAIQGATIAASTDFAGSAGAEYSAQYNEGKNMGEAIDYALRRSLAQAGVSGLGGALLPVEFGNKLFTSIGQSAIQGVAGYASAAAGAAAVDEELSSSEAALNVLMGVATALPEVVAVGAGETVSKRQIIQEIEDGLVEQALQNKATQEDEQHIKAAYLAGVVGDLVDRIKESKTAARSDQLMRDFIKEVREENESLDAVYVDVEAFNQTLDKYNVPIEDIFEMSPEIARQWERVEDIEGTIRIPLDELLSMSYRMDNDPLIQDIIKSMRSDPLAPNAYEANASLQRTAEEMKADIKNIKDNYQKIRLEQDELASVQRLIRDDLKALEFGFEEKTGFNEQASTLVGAMYESLAQRMGIPARQLYDAMPLRIVSNEQQAAQVLNAGDVSDPINREIFNQQLSDAIDKELIAIHEIKPEGLLHADRMGGLAVPSLGVVKRGQLSTGFGDITLIAPTTMIDPKGYAKPKVYGADIYSPRYPEIEYKFDTGELSKFNSELDEARTFFENPNHNISSDTLEHRPHVRLLNDDLVKYKFLADNGIPVEKQFKTETVKSAATDQNYKTTNNFLGGLTQFDVVFDQIDLDGNFDTASLVNAIREAGLVDSVFETYINAVVDAQVLKKSGERKRAILEKFDEKAKREVLYREIENVKNLITGRLAKPAETETTRQVFDRSATAKMIDDIITQKKLTSDLRKYVENTINRTMTHERIRDGYTPSGKPRYREHNLDNIVKILKKDLVGGESFNYGLGSVRARYTPQLKSLDSIRNHADRLVSTKDFNDIKDQVNSVYSDLQSKVDDYGTFDGWNNFDNMLKDVPSMGLDRALSENGFKNVPENIKGEIAAFLKVLAEMPTEYFEAKIERAVKLNEFSGAVVPEGAEPAIIDALRKNGIEDIRFYNKTDNPREQVIAGFADQFFQKSNEGTRGQIQFRKDKKGAVIIMGKNANFSTFAHEIGHHFLELNMMFGRRPDAPEQLKTDMETVLNWAGLDPDLSTWNSLTPEQKTEVHEKFAESFEQYMFTGKSPSNALRQVFARFRTFMTAVYKNLERFLGINKRADLNPEIVAVMDRLVATQEAIDQVQRQRNLEMLITPEMATKMGIPFKEYADMQQSHQEATEAAINELEQKTIKDLAWYRNLRNKHIAAFNAQAKRVRQGIKEKAAEEVADMPVYQAIAYLRQPVEKTPKIKRDPNVVDTNVDNLLEAIAKMGGIDADEIASTWGIDQPESYKVNVGRVKKVARKGGLSIETVAERLAEYGYLEKDEYDRFDTRQLEDLFTDSLSGGTFYSMYADYELFNYGNDYGVAAGYVDQVPDAAKLNLEWIKAKYGEDSMIYQAIPKTGKYALASKDGFDPEAIAMRFGYESADQMIREIIDAPAPKEVIEQRTNELIEAAHSDLFDEDAVNMAIDEAVHNEIRSQMLAREMAAIAKLNGRHTELNNAAKAVAENMISDSIIRDIRPAVFSATELKLSRQYDKALRSGDTIEAARIKRNQLVNFHAAKRAHEVQAQIKSLQDLEKKIFGSDERIAKARDFNMVSIARYILGTYGISTRQANYMAELEAIREYDPVAWTELADLVQGLPQSGTDYRDMTHADFQVIDDTVRQIWHLSRETKKFILDGKRLERAEVIADLSKQVATKKTRSRVYNGPGAGNSAIKKLGSNILDFFANQRRAEQFLSWVDDDKANGVFHKYLFNPIQDALSKYRIEQRKMKDEILDIYSSFDVKEGKVHAPEIDFTFTSKQELIHAILHSGNLSNKRRLVLGRQWGELLDDGSVDYSRWDKFVQRMMQEGTITKNDMDAIQRIWNMFDGFKVEAQKVHKRINGRYFEELPNEPLATPYGTYEGGYIPADYDPIESTEAELRAAKSDAEAQKAQLNFATTGANFTKSRIDNFSDVLLLDLTKLPVHLDRELRYIHLEEQVRQVGAIIRNREFRKELESIAPYVGNIMDKWLSAVATQQVFTPSGNNFGDRIVEGLKRNTGIVFMAGNIKNAVETWTSVPQLMVAVSPKQLAVSSAKYMANAFSRESMTADVRKLSPFMDSRLDTAGTDVRYQIENLVTNPGKFKKANDYLKSQAYVMQRITQVPLEVITWNAAFNEALAKGDAEDVAIHHADGVVRQYIGDMTPEGVSNIERGRPLIRAMLMFYGWFNMVGNTYVTQLKLANEQKSGLDRIGRHAYLYMMMMAMPAILSKALTLSFNGELWDNEDDEDWSSDLTNIFIHSQAEMMMGMLPFIREPLNYQYRKTFQTSRYIDRYNPSPVLSMAETASKAGSTVVDLTFEGLGLSEDEKDKSKAVKELLQGATFVTGIPLTLPQRPLVYAIDVLVDEDQEPENSAEVARGLVSGN